MGIPRLTSHIQPYLIPTALGCSTPNCQTHSNFPNGPEKLIIDGPGLAYYLYYRLLAHKPASSNSLDAVPSYDDLGKATLIFLNELQAHQVIIENIYFDGYLPLWKRDIRLSRLEKNRQDVSNLHAVNVKGFAVSSTASGTYQIKASDLFDTSRPLPASLKGVPAPPFMVPAILDAISESAYAAITAVVPDEADPYCARAAQESGATILTSDSDLLVYYLGDHGAVAFFSSLELKAGIRSSGSCSTIEAALCRPRDLARQLGLEDIQRLAFEMKEDPSLTLLTALGLARLPASKPPALQAFIDQYQTEPLKNDPPSIPLSPPTYSIMHKQFLDPQTSEFLLQATSNPQENLCFYLPTLLDSPPKSSAWTPSTPLRFLAYSYALSSAPNHHQHHSVSEYIRKGARITPSPIPLLSNPQIISSATALASRIQALKDTSPNLPTVMAWRLFAIHEILIWCSDAEKPSPPRSACARALTGTAAAGTWTWEDLHLSAQVQAVLYSLRLLKQTLATVPPPGIKSTDLAPFQRLSVVLTELPPIAQLLPSRLELLAQVPRGFDANVVVQTVVVITRGRASDNAEKGGRDILTEDAMEAPAWEEQKRRKGRKKGARAKQVEEKGLARVEAGNLFSALERA